MNRHPAFVDRTDLLACPSCRLPLQRKENSLQCENRHTFDIAKQGYVNLAPHIKQSVNYQKLTFDSRKAFLEAGYYDHLYQAIREKVTSLGLTTLLDSGCGEGFYSRRLTQDANVDLVAVDLSKDSIKLAARSDQTKSVKWLVGDLTRLPLQDGVIDGVLDIFSPAHYQEFQRVMKQGGYLLKMVPGPGHLQELRQSAQEHLRKTEYSNQEIVSLFTSHLQLVEEQLVSCRLTISYEHAQVLAAMTPLLFQVDPSCLALDQLTHVTIEGLLLVGRAGV